MFAVVFKEGTTQSERRAFYQSVWAKGFTRHARRSSRPERVFVARANNTQCSLENLANFLTGHASVKSWQFEQVQ